MGPKLQEGSNEGLRIGKSNRNEQNEKSQLAERSFDLRTSGLWAQHASTAPLCYHYWSPGKNHNIPWHLYPNKIICQKWDSNPRPQKWTAT